MRTVLVSTSGFKNELCHSRSVLVSAHCFKNELIASLDLGLKERVMLHVQCACFDSWHD